MATTGSTKSAALALFLIIACCPLCSGQFGAISPDIIKTFLNAMNISQKVSFIADFLINREDLFHQLEDILVAGLPLLSLEANYQPGLFMKAVVPWALSHAPKLLQSNEFVGIMQLFVDEVNKVNYETLDKNSTDRFVSGLFSSMDWLSFIEKGLSLTRSQYSIRGLLPYSQNHALNYQCYNDTMDFVERLFYGSDWAVNIFDAIGKPTTGIRQGVMHFIGTYDQCMNVKAKLDVGQPLGPYNNTIDRQFGAKYCRATFPLPQSIINDVAGGNVNHTFGIPLRLTWGLCLPDSCSEKDISGLIHLGILERFNISVEEAVCTKDKDFTVDKSAQAVIGVFGVLILLVLIGTLMDIFTHKEEDEEPVRFTYDSKFNISEVIQYGDEEPRKRKRKPHLERIISFRQDKAEANTYMNPTFEGELVQSPNKKILGEVQIPVVGNDDVKLRRAGYLNEIYKKVEPATTKERNEDEEEDDLPEKEQSNKHSDISNSSVQIQTKESNSEREVIQYGDEEPKKQTGKRHLERVISFRQNRTEANTHMHPTYEGEIVQSPKKKIVGGVQIPVLISGDVKLRRSGYLSDNYEKMDPATITKKNKDEDGEKIEEEEKIVEEEEEEEIDEEEDGDQHHHHYDLPKQEENKEHYDITNSSLKTLSEESNSERGKTLSEESNSERAQESAVVKFFRAFSIYTNAANLLSTEEQLDDISCIYGIRFLSMTWILLGNTYVYNVLSLAEAPVAGDMMDTFKILKRFTFQAVLAGTHAVDTFFMISGCLVTYRYLNRLEEKNTKGGFKHWLKFYLGRYFKFTPAYMLVLAFFSILYMYLGHGPLWPERIVVGDKCRENWWHNILYVNNFLDTEGTDAYSQCMSWSWFLAVLMQLYLISPVIFTIMATSSSLGIVIGVLLILSGIAATGDKAHQYPGDILSMRTDGGAYWNNVFIKPWCNLSSYAIGMVLGLILQKINHQKMNRILCGICWITSVCLGALIVYCTFIKYMDGAEPWTDLQNAVYQSVGRPAWSLGVAWVVYACDSGFGGFVNSILSWRGFIPLSRLTFMVYLLNPIIMVQRVYTMEILTYLGDMDMIYMFIGHTVISYAVAFVLSFVVDAPFRNLKRLLTNKYLKL